VEMSVIQSSQLNGTANVICDCSQQIAEGLRAQPRSGIALRQVKTRARTWNGGIILAFELISSVILLAGGIEDVTTSWCLDLNCPMALKSTAKIGPLPWTSHAWTPLSLVRLQTRSCQEKTEQYSGGSPRHLNVPKIGMGHRRRNDYTHKVVDKSESGNLYRNCTTVFPFDKRGRMEENQFSTFV
jgi:hypothetical protein